MTSHGHPTRHSPTQPTDPWLGEAPTANYARFGDTQSFPVTGQTRPRRSRTPLIVTIGVVVALVAGVGAYVAASVWYGWSITEPEEVLPANTAAYARLDLSPGLGQRIAMGRIAQKFPHDGDGRDIADQLKRGFLGLDQATFDKEIRPWLGDRIAVGAWSTDGTSRGTCGLAALASTNDDVAEASLGRVRSAEPAGTFGYVRHNGYAILARCDGHVESQSAAQAALTQATTQSLAQLPAFRQAMSELPGQHAAVAWVDLSLSSALQPGTGSVDLLGLKLPAAARAGQLIAGLEATGDGLNINYRLSGAGAPQATVDVLPKLGQLADNTVIGTCTDLNASTVVSQLGQSIATALAGGPFATLSTGLAAALSSVMSLAVTVPAQGEPAWRITAETTSGDRAGAVYLAYAVPALLSGVKLDRNGNTVTATSRGYLPTAGHLADSAVYRRAMGEPPGRPVAAAYIDVATLLPTLRLTGAEAANLKPIQAVGLVTSDDAGTIAGLIRILVP